MIRLDASYLVAVALCLSALSRLIWSLRRKP